MDPLRFDSFTRSLVTVGSRRTALRLLAAASLGGTISSLDREDATARCGRIATNGRRADRCDRRTPCCRHALCRRGRCRRCASGWTDCDGNGVCNTRLGTEANCGRCGDTCDEFEACRPLFDSPGRLCCRPLQQVCDGPEQCCFETSDTITCRPIANDKGGTFGCGFLEQPNPPARCCLPDGEPGARGDCDCCGTAVALDGTCIPAACAPVYARTCTEQADCGTGCFLTCQPAPDQGDPDRRRCLP